MNKKAVFIGASAGGIEPLKELVHELPPEYPFPIFVVVHIPPYVSSCLPEVLGRATALPVCHPKDGELIVAGKIYVAPPDHHLLVDGPNVAVKKGPKENRFRPSIDALFRSGAYTYGPSAIGIVLSGVLDDGTSGLWSIKRLGGTAITQQPEEARFDTMPRSALEYVDVDHSLPAAAIGRWLASSALEEPPRGVVMDPVDQTRMKKEIEIAAEDDAFNKRVLEFGELTPFTCPECHGVLVRISEGTMSRFRCHTGHAYSDNALLEAVMQYNGELLWQVIRSLEEAVLLLSHMGNHLKDAGSPERAEIFFAKAKILKARSETYHDDVLRHESLSGDNLGQ